MPPDTSVISDQLPQHAVLDRIIDSLKQTGILLQEQVDSLGNRYYTFEAKPSSDLPGWLGYLFFIGMIVLFIYQARKKEEPIPDHAVYKMASSGDIDIYNEWLTKYNPYYNALPAELKQRFLYRTLTFMSEKQFRFHAMVGEEYIPVLISGAAVQLTFGLKNFTLDYFPVIHVIRKEYVLNIDKETYYGHVSKSGIYISWAHFMEGYHDYSDSTNLGLHEMAHAVSYDVYLGEQDMHDVDFRNRLKEYIADAIPVFRSMRAGYRYVLDDYAMENFDEFWAVCVETFFENPLEFREALPDLYEATAYLLNQDPLRPEKIIDPDIAGLAY